jgi:glycosyltransferase involved in cell wall biosynthesis
MRLIQIITDVSSDSGYGGPTANCLGQCYGFANFLQREGNASRVKVFSTYLDSARDLSKYSSDNLSVEAVPARRFSSKYKFSFQMSFKASRRMVIEIAKSDVVHIHFAREFIPTLAALTAILMRKPFFLQTHGMLTSSAGKRIRLWDSVFTRFIFTKVTSVYFLSEQELVELRQQFGEGFTTTHLPNAVSLDLDKYPSFNVPIRPTVAFISRIDSRKRPEIFLEVATELSKSIVGLDVVIAGPPGNAFLEFIESLKRLRSEHWYVGALPHADVMETLSRTSLLILPSYKEPFPMIVLEALSRGVPVLVMDDCGMAPSLMSLDANFVCQSDPELIISSSKMLLDKYNSIEKRSDLSANALSTFSVEENNKVLFERYNRRRPD